jgi:hypothetical protein
VLPSGSIYSMASTRPHSQVNTSSSATGPCLIAVGLVVLIAAGWIPSLPVVTAMAVLALGATGATLVRFQGASSLRPIMLLHAATYATLYVLFAGAVLHAPSSVGLSRWAQFDLAASILPMALAAQRLGGTLWRR